MSATRCEVSWERSLSGFFSIEVLWPFEEIREGCNKASCIEVPHQVSPFSCCPQIVSSKRGAHPDCSAYSAAVISHCGGGYHNAESTHVIVLVTAFFKPHHHRFRMLFWGTASDEQKETALDWFQVFSECYSGYVAARIKPVRYDVTPAEGDQKARAELECETTVEKGSSKK